MRFFEIVLSGAALITAAFAVEINDYPSSGVQAGQTYTITYSPKDQTSTTFILRRGLSTALDVVGTIGTATGGTFTWTVPRDLPNAANYALEIRQDGQTPNYSGQFGLTGGSGSVSSAVASASAAVSSASAAVSSASAAASSASAVASSARASASSVVASVSSRVSSASAASASSASAASASISSAASASSTVATSTVSRSSTSTATKSASTTTSGIPQSTGAASSLDSSPLALVFGAIAAIAYLH